MADDARAVVVVVDDDADALATTEAALRNRYGADYDVLAFTDPEEALAAIRALADAGRRMALVLADLWMPATTGLRFFDLADDVFPTTKRVLLASWQDRSTRQPILEAFALGSIDCHLPKPTQSPDEAFHLVVTEALAEWSNTHAVRRPLVRVIGDHGAPRCHEMRDLLERYSVPYRFRDAGAPDGQAVLDELGVAGETKPVLALHDGRVLVDPSNRTAADALGGAADLADSTFDVVVVGAGPAGLAAAVYATSEGLRTLVVEREAFGGQAGTTSRIRNYLGFPRGVTGSDLASRAHEQALHFGAHFHLMRESLRPRPGFPCHELDLSDGETVRARAVVATGGHLLPARRSVPGAPRRPRRVLRAGGERSAGHDWAACLHRGLRQLGRSGCGSPLRYASKVTVLVRGDSLAASMSNYLIREIEAAPNIDVRFGAEAVEGVGDRRLEELVICDRATGTTERVAARICSCSSGASPAPTGSRPRSSARPTTTC